MQIYRAEDGEVFQVNKALRDIESFGSLEQFLHDVTGVDAAAVLAYLSDGRRLRDENLRELAGAVDQSIFVFNKHYLDYELDDILLNLRVSPPLQPECNSEDSCNTDALANAAILHYDAIMHIFNTVNVQHEALRIASTSLDLNVLSISDAFEGFAGGGRRELEKQALLLQGLEVDLEVIGKIRIHPEFLSLSVRKAAEAGEKARTLGDYVSNVKMRQVGDACAKTYNELRGRFNAAEDSMARLSSGADSVRSSVVNSGLVSEAELCTKRSQEVLERITEIKAQLQEPRTDEVELLTELGKGDVVLRGEVKSVVDIKNNSTALCMRALRQISHLNNDLLLLPQILSSLQSDFRVKTNFAHIQRLHNMLYVYGATLVEIVRRKEFSRFFAQRAQTIAEIMAKLSSSERKRRQIYRGEVHGQLPFDAKGMDDPVPTMEITSTGVVNSAYSIEREDLTALLDEIDKIDQSQGAVYQIGDMNHNSLRETRSVLEKLISRMDNLEASFDKMAEKTIFSASRVTLSRRQATDHTDSEYHELLEQLHDLQDAKSEQERQFMEDRHVLQTEIDRLHSKLRSADDQASHERQRAAQVEEELHHEQARCENEALARRALEHREAQLTTDIDSQQKELSDAAVSLAEQEQISGALRQELAKTIGDFQEAKRLEMEASGQVMKVLSEKELLSQSLEDARARERELESQLEAAREKVHELNRDLNDAHEEKDRRLRAQALEADRVLRDVVVEADADRAVLEGQCYELRAVVEATERQLKESKAQLDTLNADAAETLEELRRKEHELQDVRDLEHTLRNELRSAENSIFKMKAHLEDSERMAKDILYVASAFRDSYHKASAVTQVSSSSAKSLASLADSATMLKSCAELPPIDLEDLAGGLRILSEYDLVAFNDTVAKMGSTIRKWQKQCKEYRDRAKGKISFRNFAKGDLALFLPTRNSISKPWAAFNVSFPHYFLQATGNLSEQLKTREWIVARITSITEQVASMRDPTSNPYGLSDGTKFYMLQVEDWTQSSPRRKTSPQKPNSVEGSADSPKAPSPDASKEITDTSTSGPTTLPKIEAPLSATRRLLSPRQRTHSAPHPPHPSSLSRLLKQAAPPIEEVTERSSPSPPRLPNSRPSSPSSPPVRLTSSLVQSSSLVRASSPPPEPLRKESSSSLVSPPHSRPSSPLAVPPHLYVRADSPLGEPSHSQPSPPTSGPTHGLVSPPLLTQSYVRPASPLAGPSHQQPPSPRVTSLSGPSPAQASPKSAPSPLRTASRRSSSSSRPSVSSVLSVGRHPFVLSSSPAKASPTTALSNPSVYIPITGALSSHSREDLVTGPATPSPEGSPSEGFPGVFLSRRRTMSGSGHGFDRLSPLSAPENTLTQTSHSHSHSQGALTNLAKTWGFGRKKGMPSSMRYLSEGETPEVVRSDRGATATSSTVASSPRRRDSNASELLRRYDDILPQERGSR